MGKTCSHSTIATTAPLYIHAQSAIGRGMRILLGLLTGSDAGAVRLSLSTLRGTLLVATGGGYIQQRQTTHTRHDHSLSHPNH